ncbi:unnamed protein product [Closterium sp. Naga37s-1]|nr:unnamed protein product [Closterium sp. Naga37s-1]
MVVSQRRQCCSQLNTGSAAADGIDGLDSPGSAAVAHTELHKRGKARSLSHSLPPLIPCPTAALVNSCLLLMAVMGLTAPAVLQSTHTELHERDSTLALSRFSSVMMLVAYACESCVPRARAVRDECTLRDSVWRFSSVMMLVAYACYLYFQLKTHSHLYVDGAADAWDIPVAFISVIILPIVSSAAGAADAWDIPVAFISIFPCASCIVTPLHRTVIPNTREQRTHALVCGGGVGHGSASGPFFYLPSNTLLSLPLRFPSYPIASFPPVGACRCPCVWWWGGPWECQWAFLSRSPSTPTPTLLSRSPSTPSVVPVGSMLLQPLIRDSLIDMPFTYIPFVSSAQLPSVQPLLSARLPSITCLLSARCAGGRAIIFKGIMLVLSYLIVAASFYVHNDIEDPDDPIPMAPASAPSPMPLGG